MHGGILNQRYEMTTEQKIKAQVEDELYLSEGDVMEALVRRIVIPMGLCCGMVNHTVTVWDKAGITVARF
jgi:uncharacterized protein YxjI